MANSVAEKSGLGVGVNAEAAVFGFSVEVGFGGKVCVDGTGALAGVEIELHPHNNKTQKRIIE